MNISIRPRGGQDQAVVARRAAFVIAVCVLTFGGALALVLAIGSEARPLTLLVLAVVIVTAYQGFRLGIAVAVTAAMFSASLLLDESLTLFSTTVLVNIAVLIVTTVVVASVVSALRSAEDIADVRRRLIEEMTAIDADRQAALTKLERVLALVPVGIAIAEDPDSKYLRINDEFARILGIPDGNIGSRSAPPSERPSSFKLCKDGQEIPPEDLPLQVAARTGHSVAEHEVDVVRDDGVTLNVLIDAAPLLDDRGSIRGSVASIVDVTELRRIERALVSSERRLQIALKAAPLTMFMQDRDLRYTWASRVRPELPVQQVVGLTDADLFMPDEAATMTCLKRSVIATGRPAHTEIPVKLNGETFTFDVTIEPLRDDDNGIAGIVGAAYDTTERKRGEEALREANRQKDDFVGFVSHELKTPLTVIRGNASLLEQRGELLQESDRSMALHDIAASASRVERIIDELLILARVNEGERLELETVLTQDLVRRAVEDHQQAFTHRDIRLRIDAESAFVRVSPSAMRQVIGNLLSNAEKYSPPDHPITVTVSRDNADVSVTVRDEGAGFAEDEAEKLFSPFYRSATTASTVTGLGIGLSVCRRLVEAQNGRIWARPAPGGGAEFIVAFSCDGC